MSGRSSSRAVSVLRLSLRGESGRGVRKRLSGGKALRGFSRASVCLRRAYRTGTGFEFSESAVRYRLRSPVREGDGRDGGERSADCLRPATQMVPAGVSRQGVEPVRRGAFAWNSVLRRFRSACDGGHPAIPGGVSLSILCEVSGSRPRSGCGLRLKGARRIRSVSRQGVRVSDSRDCPGGTDKGIKRAPQHCGALFGCKTPGPIR